MLKSQGGGSILETDPTVLQSNRPAGINRGDSMSHGKQDVNEPSEGGGGVNPHTEKRVEMSPRKAIPRRP